MQGWRATRPVDVARLNSSVFLAVIRKYEILLAVVTPVYLIGALLLAHHRLPSFTAAHILAVAIPLFLTGFVIHLVLGLLGVMFLVAVGSLVWWRHVLAVGAPSVALRALAAAGRRLVVRLATRVDPSLLAVLVHREQTTHVAPEYSLLDQLRVALLVAPDAPPSRLTPHADQTVRTDQSILRNLVNTGNDRLPKTVYVRFLGTGIDTTNFTDDIILDETTPKVSHATLLSNVVARKGPRIHTYKLQVVAAENVSGVSVVTTSLKRSGGTVTTLTAPGVRGSFKLKRTITLKGSSAPKFVRVASAAGEWSTWLRVVATK